MIPGEIITQAGDIELNGGRETVTLDVANSGDRPIQVGSHYHFFETNPALAFDRAKTIVTYCASGGRAALVGKTLRDMGYANVRNLGGFKGWVDAGGEIEKG